MNQLRSTPKVQSLGDREKRPNLTKLHRSILICAPYHRRQNKQYHQFRVGSIQSVCGKAVAPWARQTWEQVSPSLDDAMASAAERRGPPICRSSDSKTKERIKEH